MPNKILTVIKREYMTRVRTKGFVASVFLMPMLICTVILLPSFMATMEKKTASVRRLVVIDETGDIFPKLKASVAQHPTLQQKGELRYQLTRHTSDSIDEAKSELRQQVATGEVYAYLAIPKNVFQDGKVRYYAKTISNVDVQSSLRRLLSEIVRNKRFAESGYSQLEVKRLMRSVTFDTFAITGDGENGEVQVERKVETSFQRGRAFLLIFVLYLFIIIYANSVMQNVLEEKITRIVEVIVSSIKPYHFLFGKLIGVCAACLTIFAVWVIFGAVLLNNFNLLLDAFGIDAQQSLLIVIALIKASSTNVLIYFLIYFICGFVFYSTLYAAVGAICSSNEDAQQFGALLAILPSVPVVLMVQLFKMPEAPFAIVLSHIPFFSPILMFMRINVLMPPLWEILLNILLMCATVLLVTLISGKIYRVGILMYGKRPTLGQLWQWARY
ncbi:ABC transporter permease [Candidatus Poribacteria bacterium]|nr:ABC transporter permease [Candidatus Poribacteria bacterium]